MSLATVRHLTIAAALAWPVLPASAEPVWIQAPGGSGQGHTFTLNRACFAYTAGHVAKAAGGEVMLTDREGFQVRGRTVAVDSRLDLGLIRITDPDTRARKVCRSQAPTAVHLEAALAQLRSGPPDVWLDMVSTPAGGLSRFELDLMGDTITADRIALQPSRSQRQGNSEALSTQSGDSGASVWMTERNTERSRYDREGEAAGRHRGILLGVHLGAHQGRAVAARSDRLHEFVLQALQPVQWSGIAVAPAHAKVTARTRGHFGVDARDHLLPLNDTQLDRISFEIDLSDRDQRVVGASVRLAHAQAGLTSSGKAPSLRVSTSQYRPGEVQRQRWDRGTCERGERRRPGNSALAIDCQLREARNARGVRIEFVGNPSAVRELTVLVE